METERIFITENLKSEAEKAYLNLVYTTGYFSSGFLRILKPHGLSEQQFNVLRILRENHPAPCTLSSISCRMIDKMSNATRLVDKLLAKGYVTRELCSDNRRKVDICITKKGIEKLAKIEPEVDAMISSMMGSEEEARELNHMLDRVREASPIEVF